MKLSLSQLESARRRPKFVAAAQLRTFKGMRPTFAGYWGFAVKLYHKLVKANDPQSVQKAQDYLLQHCRAKLSQDPNFDSKIALYTNRLNEYFASHARLNQPTIQTNKRIQFTKIPGHLVSGTIGRLDIIPAGGFAATNFEERGSDWKSQLRIPIIQQALADELGRHRGEIRVGMYCIESGSHEYITLPDAVIQKGISELKNVLDAVEVEIERLRRLKS